MELVSNRIAVLVSNDLQGDSRVEKIAQTLVSLDAQVAVFGLGSARFPTFTTKNGFGIFRPACAITENKVREKTVGKKVSLKLQMYRWFKNGTRPDFLGGTKNRDWDSQSQVYEVPKPNDEPDHQWRIDALEHSWRKRLLEWAPNAIHANDADTIGIAVRVAEELRNRGKKCVVLFDQHEYLPGMSLDNASWKEFMLTEESKYIENVQAVTTVSDFMLDDLKNRYMVKAPTAVILNAPSRILASRDPKLGTVKGALGLHASIPLHVYVGILAPKRGLHTAVEALALVEDHHVAIVTRSRGQYFEALNARAHELGVSDRLHWLPYVDAGYVSTYISDATSGLVTHVSVPAHEVSLGTKVYEYVFAGLPIISSDGRFRSEVIREHSLGEIFSPEDVQGLAQAMLTVVERGRDFYTKDHRALIDEWSWENQGSRLLEIYRSIM